MPFTAAITGFQRSQLFGPMLSPGSLNMNGVEPEPIASSSSKVVVAVAAHLLHAVDAGAEGLLARAGEHDAAHVVVAAQPAPQRVQLALHDRVERVEPVGPVQRDVRDAVALLVQRASRSSGRRPPGRLRRRRCASMPGFIVRKW